MGGGLLPAPLPTLPRLAPAPRRRLTQQLDLKQHALGLLEDRVAGSESAQLAVAVDQLKQQLAEAQAALEGARAKKMELVAQAKVGIG